MPVEAADQDALRTDALHAQEVGTAVNDRPCFARAGTCQDEHVPTDRSSNDVLLGGVRQVRDDSLE